MPGRTDPKYAAAGGFKICFKCQRSLPVSAFYKRSNSPDGYRNDCRECVSDRSREFYDANREQQKTYAREWYRNNPKRARSKRQSWYKREGRERARQQRQAMTVEERLELNRQQREARAADPERFRRYDLKRRLARFGVTLEQYEVLIKLQNGVCAICKGPPSGKDDVFHVDHDHQTGKLRGLLCHYCNTSLGGFRDDVAVLQRAIDYLTAPPFQRVG